MPEYGIINLDFPYTTDTPWRFPRGHIVYQKKLDNDILDILQKYGFDEAVKYINNSRKVLVDRNSENVVLLSFPAKSGGHFFGNSLSLSSDIVIENYSTAERKCNYICSGYNAELKYWNDVNIAGKVDGTKSKFSIFISHTEEDLSVKKLWNFWNKSDRVILFKNISLFIGLRKCIYSLSECGGYCEDGVLRHETLELSEKDLVNLQLERASRNTKERKLNSILEKSNVNLNTYKKLSPIVQNNLKEVFNDKKSTLPQTYSYCQLKTKKQIYFWDVNWYLDEEEFLSNMESFYIGLELSGFNKEILRLCYRCWISAMCRCLKNNFNI
jgi:hypothetical protein